MERIFKLKAHGTTAKTEVLAGFTTFFAMAYIIFVNPNFLAQTGMDFYAVLLATCVASAIGCFLTAFLANVPFAQAPGMGLNAFFTYSVCFGMGFTWQQGLAIVFISGIVFLIITVTPLRKAVIRAIPMPLKAAIGAGIGLFLALIGLCDAGIIDFSSGVPDLTTELLYGAPMLAIIGIVITMILLVLKVKGAIFIGIIATMLIGIPMGVSPVPTGEEMGTALSSMNLASAFQMDFNLAAVGIVPAITAIFSFFLVDMFDTIGTLIGTAGNAGMLDEEGNFPGGDRALIADAIATCAGACLGTSTVTTYVESATGIEEGGRTGLTSVVVGLLFIAFIFIAPIAKMIPMSAVCAAIVVVGVLMMGGVKQIDWKNLEEAIPCFLAIAIMPFSYSISDGIGWAFISWCIIKLVRGKGKEVSPILYVIAGLFIVMYLLMFL